MIALWQDDSLEGTNTVKKIVFIAQPFDGQKYDQRYKDDYEPAILEAGFEPYRVDRDASASIPIDEIEKNIENSFFVFSDISEDNPNVWFEVGYAIAKKKEVCFVCSRERLDKSKKFPFDTQHRNIIVYDSNSRSDWDKPSVSIRERIDGIRERLERNTEIEEVLQEQVVVGGDVPKSLSAIELAAFGIIAAVVPIGTGISDNEYAREMDKAGYTGIAANIAIRRLTGERLVEGFEEQNYNGDEYSAYRPTNLGWNFLDTNISAFKLRKVERGGRSREIDEEIPF